MGVGLSGSHEIERFRRMSTGIWRAPTSIARLASTEVTGFSCAPCYSGLLARPLPRHFWGSCCGQESCVRLARKPIDLKQGPLTGVLALESAERAEPRLEFGVRLRLSWPSRCCDYTLGGVSGICRYPERSNRAYTGFLCSCLLLPRISLLMLK